MSSKERLIKLNIRTLLYASLTIMLFTILILALAGWHALKLQDNSSKRLAYWIGIQEHIHEGILDPIMDINKAQTKWFINQNSKYLILLKNSIKNAKIEVANFTNITDNNTALRELGIIIEQNLSKLQNVIDSLDNINKNINTTINKLLYTKNKIQQTLEKLNINHVNYLLKRSQKVDKLTKYYNNANLDMIANQQIAIPVDRLIFLIEGYINEKVTETDINNLLIYLIK